MRQERYNQKKSNRRSLKVKILVSVALLILIGVAVGISVTVLSDNIYDNRDEFVEFADMKFKEHRLCKADSSLATEYYYQEKRSYATTLDRAPLESIDEYRTGKIKAHIDKFQNDVLPEDSEESEDDIKAMIVEASVHDTGTGAYSLIISYTYFKKYDKDMVYDSSSCETKFFDSKTGQEIDQLQVMNINFKDFAAIYGEDYFVNKYSEEDRREGWEKYVIPNDQNFNSFILTDSDVIFIFDEQTVLKKSYGLVSMAVSRKFMQSSIRPVVLDRYIDPSKPMVALTYDDGPGAESEKRILNILKKYNGVATFFYLGSRMENFAYNAKYAAEIGCEIGNHSWDHPQYSTLSKKQLKSQIKRTNDKIKEICGVYPVVARPPYGDYNDKVLKTMNMASILWTVDTLDWKVRNGKKVYKTVKKTKKLDGKIILMHSIYDETADATAKIVPWLKKHGYQMVTVSELIKYKTGETPKAGVSYRSVK